MQVLVEAGADLLACETLPCLSEARALARLLAEFPGVSAWISFTCRDGEHNSQGERFSDCVKALEPFDQVVALGVNCSAPHHISSLLRSASELTDKPMLTYPNSGETYDAEHKCWHATVGSGSKAEVGGVKLTFNAAFRSKT